MFSRVDILEKASFLFLCGWTKTEVLECDVTLHISTLNRISIILAFLFGQVDDSNMVIFNA